MLSRRLLLALASSASLAACGDDGLSPANAAFVQFINASQGPMFATNEGGGFATNVAVQTSSCVLVPPGTQVIKLSRSGTPVAAISTSLAAGQRYTVVLSGASGSANTFIAPENYTAAVAGTYKMRFINASSEAGDIYVTTPTATVTPPPTLTLAAGTATGGTAGVNSFFSFPLASSRVRFFAASNTTTALADLTVPNPTPAFGSTIVFADGASGVTAFIVGQCSLAE